MTGWSLVTSCDRSDRAGRASKTSPVRLRPRAVCHYTAGCVAQH
jgi:hypothetical protein